MNQKKRKVTERPLNSAPVYLTERTVFQRLKKYLLAEEGLVLRKYWRGKWLDKHTKHYAIEPATGVIIYKYIDLEGFAREKWVMEEHEHLSHDEKEQ